jgi:hypothetical protein
LVGVRHERVENAGLRKNSGLHAHAACLVISVGTFSSLVGCMLWCVGSPKVKTDMKAVAESHVQQHTTKDFCSNNYSTGYLS